jgi:hypothetical protein
VNFDPLLAAPLWLHVLIIGAAAWSTFQLVAFDDILDRPRRYVLRMGKEWQPGLDPKTRRPYEVPDDYRLELGIFVTCPYCAGFWIWVAWITAWLVTSWTLIPALILGGRALVVAGHKLLAKEEDK